MQPVLSGSDVQETCPQIGAQDHFRLLISLGRNDGRVTRQAGVSGGSIRWIGQGRALEGKLLWEALRSKVAARGLELHVQGPWGGLFFFFFFKELLFIAWSFSATIKAQNEPQSNSANGWPDDLPFYKRGKGLREVKTLA